MAQNSKIEWCDHTWNPWWGCSKVAPGCAHCYAEALSKRYGRAQWGPQGTRTVAAGSYWRQPAKWNRAAEKAGQRARVFCASMSDVFEEWAGPMLYHKKDTDGVPFRLWKFEGGMSKHRLTANIGGLEPVTMRDVREDLFALIDETPNLDWLLLTKRPENIRRMMARPGVAIADQTHVYRPNVWLGCSVATQEDADKNLPELVKCRDLAPVLFVSAEPLLGPVNLSPWARGLNWVIVGGESGPGARPMHPDWARSIRNQCQAADTPFFMKQMDKKSPIPDDLYIRQFPNV